MRKKFVQLMLSCLSAIFLLSMAASAAYEGEGGYAGIGARVVRIGIYYGSSGKSSIDLTLTQGDGFQFGTYDSSSQFVPAQDGAFTEVKQIAVKADPSNKFGFLVLNAATGETIYSLDDRGLGTGLAVMPFSRSGEKTVTKCGYAYYGGFRFERFTANNELMTIVNYLQLDDYVKGVVPYEASPSWPIETLKAQAVCARTYALTRINANHQNGYHFDLCDNVHCQAYKGIYAGSLNYKIDEAVNATSGVTVQYNGQYCETVYSSSNGGASESNINVNGKDIPYLTGKEDPYEALIADSIPKYNWSESFTGRQLQEKLVALGRTNCGEIAQVRTTLSDTGNVIALTFTDVNGTSYTIYRNSCRTALTLRSLRYSVSSENGTSSSGGSGLTDPYGAPLDFSQGISVIDGDGNISTVTGGYAITADGVREISSAGGASSTASGSVFTFTGTGWGHNVGLSQYGAYAMAELGHSYRDILEFYYTGVTVG